VKQHFAVTHTVRQTEVPALPGASIKILYPPSKKNRKNMTSLNVFSVSKIVLERIPGVNRSGPGVNRFPQPSVEIKEKEYS
jgi:hypothetical protein